jgi:hypothetical protein
MTLHYWQIPHKLACLKKLQVLGERGVNARDCAGGKEYDGAAPASVRSSSGGWSFTRRVVVIMNSAGEVAEFLVAGQRVVMISIDPIAVNGKHAFR